MNLVRSALVGLVVISCFFLTGFKQPTSKHGLSSKNEQLDDAKHQQKPLNLTVPQNEVSFQEPPEVLTIAERILPETIAMDSKSKNREVELQGKVIMSQEPEAGKMKTADGAGIVINLHH
jgi:hypothetical protein